MLSLTVARTYNGPKFAPTQLIASAIFGLTPATVKKIPAYLTPALTSLIKIEYPTITHTLQNRMNGPRVMYRSAAKLLAMVVINPSTYGGVLIRLADAPTKFRSAMMVGVKSASEYSGSAIEMYMMAYMYVR